MVFVQSPKRIIYAAIAVLGLVVVYLFQRVDFLSFLTTTNPILHFAVNRAVRIFANDLCMLILIYALFKDPAVVRLSIAIQLIDLFVLFPLYLALKLPAEGASEISSPFLSQLHRLIVHPTLMILLIPALYYQRFSKR